MTSVRVLVTAALCAGLAAACAKSKGPEAGTNTNWLQQCRLTADCQGDGSCLCGVCTLACSNDSACDVVGGGARCEPLSAATCGGTSTSAAASACLPPDMPVQPKDAGSAPPTPIPDAGLTLTRVGAEVQVSDRYRPCGIDDDCVLVATGCDGCCQQDAVRARDRDAYQTNFELACRGYQGAICDCQPLDLVPLCQDGLCRALPRDQARDCYSPTQNVARAYDPGAVGCPCEPAGLQICVAGAALICDDGPSGLAWTAVEDGPCALDMTDCPTSSRRPDASACLAEFATCVERAAGGFCGVGCRGPFSCDKPEGCDYTSFDRAQCQSECAGQDQCGPYLFVYEGTCGDVRYRLESGGYGGPTWYWSAASGELLAMVYSTDTNAHCNGADFQVMSGDLRVVQACDVVADATTALCGP